jgi:hypothetical protein
MRSPNAGFLTSRLQRKLAEWATERRGQTAVEFALIAAPFFFIIFGLMEICLIFIMSTVLEHAVSDASREIRTGQAQEAGFSKVEFQNSVCDEMFGLMGCDASLHIDVKRLAASALPIWHPPSIRMAISMTATLTSSQAVPTKSWLCVSIMSGVW